jgi:hypothetical protein
MSIYTLFTRSCLLALVSIQHVAYSITSTTSKNLPLPASLANKPVQYLRVKQLPNWSCGYNALYNACRIEQLIGLPNKHTESHYFNRVCQPYALTYDHGPMSSSSNVTLTALAPQLGLQKLTCLYIDNANTIRPLGLSITCGFSYQDSPQTREHKKQKAIHARSQEYLNKLVQDFNTTPQPTCKHFICNIDTARGRHWVLVSVTKNNKGERQLYVCDNMNSPITAYSQMEKYLHYIYNLFNVHTLHNAPVTQKPSLPIPVHPVQLALFKQQHARRRKAKTRKLLAQYKLYKTYGNK